MEELDALSDAPMYDDTVWHGRVPDADVGAGRTMAMVADSEQAGGSFDMTDSLQHTVAPSRVQAVFFSRVNTDALQDGIRYRVFQETGGEYVIGRQSDVELGLIMRSIYLQYGRNDEGGGTLSQVRDLNQRVLDYCVPLVTQELSMYMRYRQDVAQMPVPMDRGQLATTKGSRTLELMR